MLCYVNVAIVYKPYFGDGLITGTFDNDLYVMRFYVFSLVNVV
jgi:hypothetical protein